MANPFPMAAVVLPAASKASVLYLTCSPSSLISAIPPALSLIGPYASMANEIARFESIPIAPSAIPKYVKSLKQTKIITDKTKTGMIVDL